MIAANTPAPRIRVAAAILNGDQLLMVRHEKDGRSYWLLPGGGVDVGETLQDALHRELWEEMRVKGSVGDLVLVNDAIAPDASRHILQIVFTASITEGTPKLGEDPRVVEIAYQPIEAIPTLTVYPSIADELYQAAKASFPQKAQYLGNIWAD